MITNTDRSLWIGASDSHFVVANHGSDTWQHWWAVKTGLISKGSFKTKYTHTGDVYERSIVTAYGEDVEFDKCLTVPRLALKANLDANTAHKIIEAKTYNYDKGIPDRRGTTWKHYWMQVQVQMYAWKCVYGWIPKAEIRLYGVDEDDYEHACRYNQPLPMDIDRLESRPIEYDEMFINTVYLPKLMPLAEQLNALRGDM